MHRQRVSRLCSLPQPPYLNVAHSRFKFNESKLPEFATLSTRNSAPTDCHGRGDVRGKALARSVILLATGKSRPGPLLH
jgi:hypothetical protein